MYRQQYSLYLQQFAANLGRTMPGDAAPPNYTLEDRYAIALAAIDSRGPTAALKTYSEFETSMSAAVAGARSTGGTRT